MAKKRKLNHKAFLKKFKDETLAIVERKIEREGETSKVLIVIINDFQNPKAPQEALKFTKDDKMFNILPLSGLWQAFFDGKSQLTEEIVTSKVVYDFGLIQALKSTFMIRNGLLKKFNRYLISVVLFGSWARGSATKKSDVDVGVIIDDTDVKATTRVELREKIRRIVHGISAEVSTELNIQTYLLTQFWEYVRDANPVVFTLLRDGVPILDRGLFSPWKLLLKMGKIKPTPEAIKTFISSGKLLTKTVSSNLNEILIEKLYYAMLNPAQAALMFIGIAPPAYSETSHLLRRYFVEKKMIDKKYADWLDEIIEIRKRVEHDRSNEVNGKLIDKFMKRAIEFSERIDKLFDQIRKETIGEKLDEIDYLAKKGMKRALEVLGLKATEKTLLSKFKQTVNKEKIIPVSYTEFLDYFTNIKEDFKKGLVTQEEVNRLEKNAHDFLEAILEFAKTSEIKGTDKFKIKVAYGNKKGEIWIFEKKAFIIKDLKSPESKVFKTKLNPNGTFAELKESSLPELTNERKKTEVSEIAKVKEKTIESLKEIFGKKVEIIIE